MTRRDALHYAAILGTVLAACILVSAMDAPRPQIIPTSDKPPAPVVLVRKSMGAPELVSLGNPTPLSDELYRAVLISSTTYEVPECLALGLIEVESGVDADAVSPKGCYGLCQLNPEYLPSGLTPEENIDALYGREPPGEVVEERDAS